MRGAVVSSRTPVSLLLEESVTVFGVLLRSLVEELEYVCRRANIPVGAGLSKPW